MLRSLILFLLFFLFFTTNAYADSNFSTNYNITYSISENQNTHVQFDISLVNKTDIFYASSYKIILGFDDVDNLKATDGKGNILKKLETIEDQKVVNVLFNEEIAGINNKLNFTISFDTSDVAKKVGEIWEINIPGLSSQSDVSSFNVSVVVPNNFGQAAFIKPVIKDVKINNGKYNFTKDDLGSSGISITFGKTQVYKLKLVYHLYNKNLFPIRTEIALPPTTNYQKTQIENISQKPTNVTVDNDGNWLAEYSLNPSEKKDIIVDAKILVNLLPEKQPESKTKLKNYLKNNEYWETTNKKILEKAGELKTPYEVYKFVSDTLEYDYSRVSSEKPRLGALKTLENPSSAVCLEFTDLFIALARAAGIPAREIDGYAYTDDAKQRPLSLVKDILHAWPEYYDTEKQTWIMIDPTWANTTGGLDFFYTLDFDHIAFVRKGEDSSYPVPAGGYKLPGGESVKDINVSFDKSFGEVSPIIQAIDNLPKNLVAGFNSGGNMVIKNSGKILAPSQKITVMSDDLISGRKIFYSSEIPPYGSEIIPIVFNKTSFLTNKTDEIKIMVGETVINHKIKITPIFLNKWFLMGGAIIFGGIIISISIIAIKPWNLSLLRRKGEDSLRRESKES